MFFCVELGVPGLRSATQTNAAGPLLANQERGRPARGTTAVDGLRDTRGRSTTAKPCRPGAQRYQQAQLITRRPPSSLQHRRPHSETPYWACDTDPQGSPPGAPLTPTNPSSRAGTSTPPKETQGAHNFGRTRSSPLRNLLLIHPSPLLCPPHRHCIHKVSSPRAPASPPTHRSCRISRVLAQAPPAFFRSRFSLPSRQPASSRCLQSHAVSNSEPN